MISIIVAVGGGHNLFNKLIKKLTKNYTKVPLFWVDFNLEKYQKYGAKNSCTIKIHPVLKDDECVKQYLNDLIFYIRNYYDMNDLTK